MRFYKQYPGVLRNLSDLTTLINLFKILRIVKAVFKLIFDVIGKKLSETDLIYRTIKYLFLILYLLSNSVGIVKVEFKSHSNCYKNKKKRVIII